LSRLDKFSIVVSFSLDEVFLLQYNRVSVKDFFLRH
jgi:hypothetical protein